MVSAFERRPSCRIGLDVNVSECCCEAVKTRRFRRHVSVLVELTSGSVSACRAWGAVWARVRVIRKAVLGVLGVGSLARLLVGGGDGMAGRVRRMLLRLSLRVVLLMNDARGSRMLLVLQVLSRCWTLGLMVGVMLHREKTH